MSLTYQELYELVNKTVAIEMTEYVELVRENPRSVSGLIEETRHDDRYVMDITFCKDSKEHEIIVEIRTPLRSYRKNHEFIINKDGEFVIKSSYESWTARNGAGKHEEAFLISKGFTMTGPTRWEFEVCLSS